MATNNSTKFAGSNVTAEQQGVEDIQIKAYEPVLSPEQRRILAQVYHLILGWRRERLMKTGPGITVGDTNTASPTPAQASVVKVEA